MSTITVPGWISLDSLDTFLSRHSGPWGLSSVHDYEEPALHSYSTIVPEATPQTSAAEVLLTILFYAGAFVMICAALMPTYLAFESQILKVLKPLDDFTVSLCRSVPYESRNHILNVGSARRVKGWTLPCQCQSWHWRPQGSTRRQQRMSTTSSLTRLRSVSPPIGVTPPSCS